MSQGIYQKQGSGLVFMFSTMEVEIDEQFKSSMKPFMECLKRTVAEEKVNIRGKEDKRKM